MKIALCQINPTLGDFENNKSKILNYYNRSLELNPAYQVVENDDVKLDGRKIITGQLSRTILMNKPVGYITTMHDPLKRKTVMDLIDIKERLFPIKRVAIISDVFLFIVP